jgi:hypothetical protein
MSKLTIVLGGWIALNVAAAGLLMTRRPNPHLRRRLFRWVIRTKRPTRPQRWVNSLIMAHQRRH